MYDVDKFALSEFEFDTEEFFQMLDSDSRWAFQVHISDWLTSAFISEKENYVETTGLLKHSLLSPSLIKFAYLKVR